MNSTDTAIAYRVVHRTEYVYESEVSSSYGEVHLQPRDTPWQRCYMAAVSIDPFPEHYRERRDFHGNRVAHYAIVEPHTRLVVTGTSEVGVAKRADARDTLDDLPWEEVRDVLRTDVSDDSIAAREFTLPSPSVRPSAAAARYAASSFVPGRPMLDAVGDLVARIHRDFTYAPGLTTVHTDLDEALERRVGVCQDFAHVAIAGLRAHGLPARYVSGYLETDPPAGVPRLQGADVSHAWVSTFLPGWGWVDVDPTNDQFVNERYVTAAWGRDYADVPPLKGVIFTQGAHQLAVTVDVMRIPESDGLGGPT